MHSCRLAGFTKWWRRAGGRLRHNLQSKPLFRCIDHQRQDGGEVGLIPRCGTFTLSQAAIEGETAFVSCVHALAHWKVMCESGVFSSSAKANKMDLTAFARLFHAYVCASMSSSRLDLPPIESARPLRARPTCAFCNTVLVRCH